VFVSEIFFIENGRGSSFTTAMQRGVNRPALRMFNHKLRVGAVRMMVARVRKAWYALRRKLAKLLAKKPKLASRQHKMNEQLFNAAIHASNTAPRFVLKYLFERNNSPLFTVLTAQRRKMLPSSPNHRRRLSLTRETCFCSLANRLVKCLRLWFVST